MIEFFKNAEPLDWSQWETWAAFLVFGATIALIWDSAKRTKKENV